MATEKITSTISAATHPATAPLFLAGRNLAVLVLREIRDAGPERCSIEVDTRPGNAQCDVLARALEGLRDAPTDVLRGFAAVFTDCAGSEGVVSPDHFEYLSAEEMGIEWKAASSRH